MIDKRTEESMEQLREELHAIVDQKINDFLACLASGESRVKTEIELPITVLPAYFKGKKPVSIIYPDGSEVYADKWKKVAFHLLHQCAEDECMRDRLHSISGKVYGRDRKLLSDNGNDMDVPLEFYPGMFFEAKFDTESLIKVITSRIFLPIGYNYEGIRLKVIDPQRQNHIQAPRLENLL